MNALEKIYVFAKVTFILMDIANLVPQFVVQDIGFQNLFTFCDCNF